MLRPMATLFLVRHGLTAKTGRILYGQMPGVSLDERGAAQAEALVDRLAPVRLTAVYTSPLERCVETVEPLAHARRLPLRTSDALIEMDAGSWTGKSLARLRRTRLWDEVQSRPADFRFPQGESFREAQRRAVAEVEAIARRHRRGHVVIATHGDIVRILLTHFEGAPLDRFQRSVIDTGSISVVRLEGQGGVRVLLVNDTGGLGRFGSHSDRHPRGRT